MVYDFCKGDTVYLLSYSSSTKKYFSDKVIIIEEKNEDGNYGVGYAQAVWFTVPRSLLYSRYDDNDYGTSKSITKRIDELDNNAALTEDEVKYLHNDEEKDKAPHLDDDYGRTHQPWGTFMAPFFPDMIPDNFMDDEGGYPDTLIDKILDEEDRKDSLGIKIPMLSRIFPPIINNPDYKGE
jgi:hypothetical protein